MSKKLIELENGLMMEVDIPTEEIEMISSGGDVIDKVNSSMGTIENILIQSVQPIINTYKTLSEDITISSAKIEVGIGFSAEGNIFIAKGNANANLKVKLILKPKE